MTTSASRSDDGIVELEFAVTEPAYPFVAIAQAEDCQITLEKQLPRGNGLYAEYFSVVGAEPEGILAELDSGEIHDARVLADEEQHCLVEIVVRDGCPARDLAVQGATPTAVEGSPDGGRIVAQVLPEDDPGTVVDEIEKEHAVELVAKRTRDKPTPLLSDSELQNAILDRLTDRQREVLYTAHEEGYYERPRAKTGEEIARELGISPTTFQEHVRSAERKIVKFLVEE